jgi:hypothetical protein
MDTKHTPGPWDAIEEPGRYVVVCSTEGPVCTLTSWSPQVDAADARLIAAAPDMLDLARNVGGFDDSLLASADLNVIRAALCEWRDQARAVIAKATEGAA